MYYAVRSHNLGEGSLFLSFQKGDLIQLESEDGEDIMSTRWCFGECERTKKKGHFPPECVYVLPTISKPPVKVLVSRTFNRLSYYKIHSSGIVCRADSRSSREDYCYNTYCSE